MALNLRAPEAEQELRPRITVFGVGGAGGNAVNNMIEKALEGADFVVANTDAQALSNARATRKVQLGRGVTQGLGAGAKPQVGAQAAEESLEEIVDHLAGSHMCFITAGMGGGTGTGAAPVIARAAREMGILTVGVVTKPFQFEGATRMRLAEGGIEQLQQVVDTLIIIPNQNLFRIANERTTFAEAFMMADDVLYQGVKGVTDLMVRPGLINLDFADVRAVMDEMGKAMMGTGEAEGENRAVDAAEKAIANPLLDEVSLRGARGVLINITGGYDLTLFELDEAANRIRAEVDPDANIIVGSTLDPDMANVMRVSVVATGIDAGASAARPDLDDAGSAQAVAGRSATLRPGAAARDAAADARGAARVEAVRPAVARVEPTQPETAAEAQRSETARAEPATSDAAPAAAEANLFASQDPTAGFDLDFDLDDGSLARRPPPTRPEPARDHPFVVAERAASEPSPRPAVGAARPPARAAARAEPVEERGARFGFNNLIHRMTGSSREKEQEHPFSTAAMQQRREPPAPAPRDLIDDDDARMEIPAFLRRQAN